MTDSANKTYDVQLVATELLLLDGKVSEKAQAIINKMKAENSYGFDFPLSNIKKGYVQMNDIERAQMYLELAGKVIGRPHTLIENVGTFINASHSEGPYFAQKYLDTQEKLEDEKIHNAHLEKVIASEVGEIERLKAENVRLQSIADTKEEERMALTQALFTKDLRIDELSAEVERLREVLHEIDDPTHCSQFAHKLIQKALEGVNGND